MNDKQPVTIFSPPVAPVPKQGYPSPWSGQVASPRKVKASIPSKVAGPGGKTWVGAVDNEVSFPVFYCSQCKVMRCLKEKSIENQVMEKMTDKDNTIIDFCPVCKDKTIHTKFGR